MMKKILLYTVTILGLGFNAHASLIGWSGSVYDVEDRSVAGDLSESDLGYTGDAYSGYYLGTVSGNTDPGNFIGAAQFWYQTVYGENIDLLGNYKVDLDDYNTEVGSGSDGILHVTWEDDLHSGTWALDSPYELGFYAVKGANEFALYFVDPSMSIGTWWTGHLLTGGDTVPGISHFSAAPTEKVPEPGALLLMGVGLFGIAIFGKRRRRTK